MLQNAYLRLTKGLKAPIVCRRPGPTPGKTEVILSRSLNKVTLIGNLGAEPEGRSTANGTRVATLSVATSRSWNNQAGERQEKTEWHRVVLWNNKNSGLADVAEKYLKKPASYHLSFMPPKGATFAYGFAGCPKCRASWPRFGRRMCSYAKPGKVTCSKCRTVFPSDDPATAAVKLLKARKMVSTVPESLAGMPPVLVRTVYTVELIRPEMNTLVEPL